MKMAAVDGQKHFDCKHFFKMNGYSEWGVLTVTTKYFPRPEVSLRKLSTSLLLAMLIPIVKFQNAQLITLLQTDIQRFCSPLTL